MRDVRDSALRVADVIHQVDSARAQSIGQISGQLEASRVAMSQLQLTATKLSETLTSSQARGQWGERMADDLLRAAGFVEGVNYEKNRQLEVGTRPDFTFRLPEGRTLNMDVKFPIASYVRYVEAQDDSTRRDAERQFLADFRNTVRNVATRDYVDPGQGTLDFMIVFIPNEQVYAFVHDRDPGLVDEALARKVVLCSPLTLYALLSIVRQASESFTVAQQADDILRVLASFSREWGNYRGAVAAVGRRIDSLTKAFGELEGPRTRQLERRMSEVDELRLLRGVDDAELDDDKGGDDPDEEDIPN